MNISQWIERHAGFTPEKAALHFEGQVLSYAELDKAVKQAAWTLATELDIKQGDRVAVLATNSPEFLILFFACARLGAIFNPLNWRLAVPEHLFILGNAVASVLIVEEAFAELVEPLAGVLPECQVVGLDFVPAGSSDWVTLNRQSTGTVPHQGSLDDALMLVYTSGTTGLPKGAILTQNSVLFNAYNSIHMQDLTANDHVFTALPLFHVGGLNNQTTPIFCCGGTLTLQRRFHPTGTLQMISEGNVTATCMVPATLQACMADPGWLSADFSSLRICVTGSTMVPRQLSEAWRARGVVVVEMYGATETGPVAIYHRPDSDFSKAGSTGLPGLHCDAKIVDASGAELPVDMPGEVWVKGPAILREYWRDESATLNSLRDGWFATGDIGYRDSDGYYYIKDRKKNLIISGGENIYPAEVERILNEHPAIADMAVIGLPDEKWGETPLGVIVPKEGMAVDSEELIAFLKGKLAGYKIPRQYIFTDALPKNALGKTLHYQLRKSISDQSTS